MLSSPEATAGHSHSVLPLPTPATCHLSFMLRRTRLPPGHATTAAHRHEPGEWVLSKPLFFCCRPTQAFWGGLRLARFETRGKGSRPAATGHGERAAAFPKHSWQAGFTSDPGL